MLTQVINVLGRSNLMCDTNLSLCTVKKFSPESGFVYISRNEYKLEQASKSCIYPNGNGEFPYEYSIIVPIIWRYKSTKYDALKWWLKTLNTVVYDADVVINVMWCGACAYDNYVYPLALCDNKNKARQTNSIQQQRVELQMSWIFPVLSVWVLIYYMFIQLAHERTPRASLTSFHIFLNQIACQSILRSALWENSSTSSFKNTHTHTAAVKWKCA